MKPLFLSVLLCFTAPSFLTSQILDTAVVKRQLDSLMQVSYDLTTQGYYDDALAINAQAEKLALENFGRKSVAYGDACFNHGRTLAFKGDFSEAEKWYLETLKIREKTVGKEHPDYAWCEQRLGYMYSTIGEYEKAEPLLLESKTIREKTLGKEHLQYGWSLAGLGALYENLKQYEKAESYYLERKEMVERQYGREHQEYIWSLNALAGLYMKTQLYEKAESIYLETIALSEKVWGKESSEYASSLVDLESLYDEMELFEKAEPLYLESTAIFEKSLGKEHPRYISSLIDLGTLFFELGQYEKAESSFLEACAIIEKTLGKQQPEYARSLNNLGVLYTTREQFEKAEKSFLESGAIVEKTSGKESRDYALFLINMGGSLYTNTGQYEKAEPIILQSMATFEKVSGKESPEYANSLNALAYLYLNRGQYEKAEPLFLESMAIYEKTGKAELDILYSNNLLLGLLYMSTGQFEKAGISITKDAHLIQSSIQNAVSYLSEQEMNQFEQKFEKRQAYLFSLARQSTQSSTIAQAGYDNILFYKAFLLNASGHIKRLALADPAAAENYHLFQSYHRRLAVEYAKPVEEQKGVAKLEEKANGLEKELAREVADFGEALRQVDWKEVQAQLHPGDCAIEFVHFRLHHLQPTDSVIYAALLLLPDSRPPEFLPLFEEKQLDSLLQRQGESSTDYLNNLYALAARGLLPVDPSKERVYENLYDLIWKPIEEKIPAIQTVYFSPSGLLHQLNLGAIPVSQDRTLADRYHLVQLGSTRQLVIPTQVDDPAPTATLFGGIRYESDTTAIAQANAFLQPNVTFASRGELSFSFSEPTQRGSTWTFLKGTEREVTELSSVLQKAGYRPQLFQGFQATEEAFKSIGRPGNPSPRILHIATHGFFFPDATRRSVNEGSPRSFGDQPVFKISDHPMIRSGLILAGSNYAWQTGKSIRPGLEDGILTAYEISQMDLSHTELVALSACETGLGDIKGTEGVYGLQRAFKIAGAKYLIMSLWQVPDQETQVFMTTFYKNWLEGKMPIPEAFRTTQLQMRDRFLNPYTWAGFVLVE